MMKMKRFFGLCVALLVLLVSASSSLAVIKGLDGGGQAIVKVGQDINVPVGTMVRSVVAVSGSINVAGQVLEDVVAVGGSINLKKNAVVNGDVVAVGGTVKQDPSAVVNGQITEVAIPGKCSLSALMIKEKIMQGLVVFSALSAMALLLLIVLIVVLFTQQIGKISAVVEKNLRKTFLIGLLAALLVVPVVVLLAVSVVGIIFIPVWVILIAAAGMLGYVGVSHLLGKKILNALKIYGQSLLVEVLIGVLVFFLLDLIPVIGILIKAVVCCLGLGAVAMTKFGTA